MSIEQFNELSALILQSLYRASWQGGIAAALVWAICSLFPRLPTGTRSWLWRLVFVKIALAFIWARPIELALLEAVQPSDRPPQIAAATPTDGSQAPAFSASVDTVLSQTPERTEEFSPSTAPAPVAPVPTIPLWTTHGKLAMTGAWFIGAFIGFLLLGKQFRQARRLRRNLARCTEDRVAHHLIAYSRALGLARLPQICVCPNTTRPMLVGIIRPTLIFPERLVATASPESLRMMLAHELAHIRRGDLAWTTFAAIVRAIFFFHPLVWLARRESLLAQEIACDELALQATTATTTNYAEMLVTVAAIPAHPAPTLVSLGVAENCKTLERRIRNMKFLESKKSKIVRFAAALIVFLALIALIPFRIIAAKPEAEVNSVSLGFSPDTSEPRQLLEEFQSKSRTELRQVIPTTYNDPLLNSYLHDLSRMELEQASLRDSHDEDHPERKRLANIIKELNRQIDDRIDGILAGMQAQANLGSNRIEPAPTLRPGSLESGDVARILEDIRRKDRAELPHLLSTLTADPLLTEHLKALSQAEQHYAALENDYADQHPEIVKIRNVIKTIKNQIGNRVDGILAGLETKAGSANLELESSPARDRARSSEDVKVGKERVQKTPPGPISVHARVGGSVDRVLVGVGEAVKKGQPLLELDNSGARSRLNTAEARAKVAHADLRIALAELNDIQKEYTKRKQLAEDHLVSEDSLPNLEKFRANVVKAEAQAELAMLERDQAKQDLDRYILLAPRDGTVSFIIHEGYFVPEGGGKILAEIRTKEGDRAAVTERTRQLLTQQLEMLRAKEAELSQTHTERSAPLLDVKRRIAAVESRLREEGADSPIEEQPEAPATSDRNDNQASEVFVNGSVNRPGAIPITGGRELTILGAISRAGGFSERANQNKVIFTRPGEEERTLSFKDLKKPENNIPLRPGDIIDVQDKLF